MERIQNVTLSEAYGFLKVNSFVLWTVSGNYMNIETPEKGENVETRVFMGTNIYLLGLSAQREGFTSMASEVDFIDIWPSVKIKYPNLFKDDVRGEAWLIH